MYYLLLFIIITILTACGGGSNSSNQSEEVLSSFPEKVTVSLPLKLEPNRYLETGYSDKSYTYEVMQSDIIKYRDYSNEIKDDLNMLEKLLEPISNACEDTESDDVCLLEANQFSFNLSGRELRAIKKRYGSLYGGLTIDFDINKTLSLGEVSFVQHKERKPYDYSLSVDLTEVYVDILGEAYEKEYEEKYEKRLVTISWSVDNKAVHTALVVDSNISKTHRKFEYYFDENSTKTVYMKEYQYYNFDVDSEPFIINKSMIFTKNFDKNNSYDYRMQDDYDFNQGKISDSTGSHIKSSLTDNSQIITFFDKNGTELGQYGCSGYDGCSIDDKSTWYVEYEEELRAASLDKKAELYVRNLTANEISLDEGKYFLLAPNVKIEEISKKEILKQSIGEFMVTGTELIGVLYDANYENKLSELKIVQGLSSKVIELESYPLFLLQTEVF